MNFWSNWVYPSQVHEERVSSTKRTRTCEEETARETKTSKQGLWPKAVPVSAGVYFWAPFLSVWLHELFMRGGMCRKYSSTADETKLRGLCGWETTDIMRLET